LTLFSNYDLRLLETVGYQSEISVLNLASKTATLFEI